MRKYRMWAAAGLFWSAWVAASQMPSANAVRAGEEQPGATSSANAAAARLGTELPPPPPRLQRESDKPGWRDWKAAVAFSPDGKLLASGCWDGTVRLWDVTAQKERASLAVRSRSQSTKVMDLAFSPDGKRLAVGCWDGNVTLVDVASGHQALQFRGNGFHIDALAYSPDGQGLAVVGWERKNARIFDAASGEEKILFTDGHVNKIHDCAFSPNGKMLITVCASNEIIAWNTTTGEQLQRLKTRGSGFSLAFSPDGNTLAIGYRSNRVELWEVATMIQRSELTGHQGRYVYSLVFTPDGKTLISGADDHTVRIWDMTTEKERHVLKGHPHNFTVALSPDGKLLAAAGEDATVLLWDMSALVLRNR